MISCGCNPSHVGHVPCRGWPIMKAPPNQISSLWLLCYNRIFTGQFFCSTPHPITIHLHQSFSCLSNQPVTSRHVSTNTQISSIILLLYIALPSSIYTDLAYELLSQFLDPISSPFTHLKLSFKEKFTYNNCQLPGNAE
ncbi:hypothetical protein L6452_05339 [Arctium lappa]|uniref:Uncharacterized protein n=1 Tax=Arctium lappa TaxID=4217 RepID=A0ACB9EH69_ARCLA|nr:hypothetical protein L6452_05339 [Arctium lappa]